MAIPSIFLQDIQSKDTQLFAKVVIHTENDLNYNLYYSTNKLTFKGVGVDSTKTVYWKPLLLKLPQVKEKYDIETKKFIVSKINLQFSNAYYEGARISDILTNLGLVSKNVSIYYQSQSAKTNADCLRVFYGEVKRVKHDSKKLSIEVHDLGSGKHLELPRTYLDGLIGESQGRPVPINYGFQEFAPTVVQYSGTHYKIWFDTCVAYNDNIANTFPFETSGKTTDTLSYMGFSHNTEGFYNPMLVDTTPYSGYSTQIAWGRLMMFRNGKYGKINDLTEANHYDHDDGEIENNLSQEQVYSIGQESQSNASYYNVNEGAEPWDNDTEPYFKMYKTRLISKLHCTGVTFGYKTPSLKINVIKANQTGYPELMEEFSGTGSSQIFERAVDGSYWGAGAWGGWAWTAGVIPDFYTPDTMNDADGGPPPEMFQNSHEPFNRFRVKLAEVIIGTDPDVGQKRINRINLHINGLLMMTYEHPEPGSFYEFNDAIENGLYYESGSWGNINEEEVPGYHHALIGGNGSIINTADAGHGDANSVYFLREIFCMMYPWSNMLDPGGHGLGNSQMNWNGTAEPFQPAFELGTPAINGRFTLGSARFYPAANALGDYRIEFYQEFEADYHLDQLIPGGEGGNHFRARLRQVDVIGDVHIENPFENPFVVNIKGRKHTSGTNPGHLGQWVEGKHLQNPVDIIRHLVEYELNFYDFDEDDYYRAVAEHEFWEFTCSIKDPIDSKELIEDIAQYTKMFPKFGVDGKFRFNSIRKAYQESEYHDATEILYDDLIDYKFELTKIDDVVSKIDLRYRWDHYNETCSKKWSEVMSYGMVSNGDWDQGGPPPVGMIHAGYRPWQQSQCVELNLFEHTEYELQFYNIESVESNTKKIECKYFTDFTKKPDAEGKLQGPVIDPDGSNAFWNDFGGYTAYTVYDYLWYQNKNQHLVFKLKLPVKYVYIDVGHILKFTKLFNGMLAYGINYTKLESINNQYRYPLFFVTGVSKSTTHIEITCFQLNFLGETEYFATHNGYIYSDATFEDSTFWLGLEGDTPLSLTDVAPPFAPDIDVPEDEEEIPEPVYGCLDTEAINYDPLVTVDDGSCQYHIDGCMDPLAINYDIDATIQTNTAACAYELGCTDPTASNYNPGAVFENPDDP